VLTAAASARATKVIHVSSISVLEVPGRGERLSEDTGIEQNSRNGGPYAWGKIESERLALSRSRELGLELRVVRPSALVDYRHFDPPGLLGKRVGNVFVAVGMPGHELGVVDVVFAAQTLAWMVRHFDDAPAILNLFDPKLPTRRDLLQRLHRTNPDLTVVWLPPIVLVPLSWFAIAIQKILRPRQPAINVAKIFARLRYDTSRIAALAPAIRAEVQQSIPSRAHVPPASVADHRDLAVLAPSPITASVTTRRYEEAL